MRCWFGMTGRNRKRGNKEAQHAVKLAGLRMLGAKKYTHAQIAAALGVAHGTVRGWSSKGKAGTGALKKKGKRGRPKGKGALLTQREERKIIMIIRDKTPKQLLISTATNRGTMRFRLYEGGLTARLLVAFLKALVAGASRKLYVIMVNLPAHKGKYVRAWLAAPADKMRVFYLPPYAPDMNPDEYLNNDLKQNAHRVSGLPLTQEALKSNVLSYVRHIQKSPAKVCSYFQAPKTQYAA